MIVKMLSFKPNKDGSVTLYLDKGADLHSLIDMTGKEISIDTQQAELPQWEFDRLMPLVRYQDAFINKLIEAALEKERAKWQQPEEAA